MHYWIQCTALLLNDLHHICFCHNQAISRQECEASSPGWFFTQWRWQTCHLSLHGNFMQTIIPSWLPLQMFPEFSVELWWQLGQESWKNSHRLGVQEESWPCEGPVAYTQSCRPHLLWPLGLDNSWHMVISQSWMRGMPTTSSNGWVLSWGLEIRAYAENTPCFSRRNCPANKCVFRLQIAVVICCELQLWSGALLNNSLWSGQAVGAPLAFSSTSLWNSYQEQILMKFKATNSDRMYCE